MCDIKGSRYVDLIHFEEGFDLFSPVVESSFRSLVLLLAAALLRANGDFKFYVRFDLQNIWLMCFGHLLLYAMVEHTSPVLRPPRLWSLSVGEDCCFQVQI